MLNIAPAVCSTPVVAVATPGAAAAPGFAQALAQAGARPGADDAAEAAATAPADPPAAPKAGESRPAPHGHGAHGADPRQPGAMRARTGVAADARAEAAPGAVADAPTDAPADADGAALSPPQDTPPADLTAWWASLPLPAPPTTPQPPAQRALGDLTAARAEAATTLGNAGVTSAHAMQALAEDAARKSGADAATGEEPTPPRTPGRPTELPTAAALPGAIAERRMRGVEADIQADPKAGSWHQALAAAREPAAAASDGGTASALLAAALTVGPAAPPRSADAAPLHAEVRAEVGSREFAPALGSQLAVLVRNGVEQAQLKLNPAELGPIEVRISIDGAQAQVDFSAAHAHTRQALQEAVPALAGALREQGLTLTGGGVFEQPRESRGEARQEPARGHSGGAEPAADVRTGHAPAARAPRARGVVDLYA